MTTMMIFHEVDDVAHWVASPKRDEVFGALGISVRTFVDPEGTNRVGIFAEVPDVDAMMAMLQSDVGAAAMKYDGVRPETIVMLVAS